MDAAYAAQSKKIDENIQMKKLPAKKNKITKYEFISITLSFLAIIATGFIGFNQVEINKYYKDENESQKRLIVIGLFDNKNQTLKIDPYINDFHITQGKLYYLSEERIKTKLFISPNGYMPIQDMTDTMVKLLLKQKKITKIDDTLIVVDGYPVVLENYYVYKGRQYHLFGLYKVSFSAPTFNSAQNEIPVISFESLTYIRSLNRKEKIETVIRKEQKEMETKLGL